MKVKLFTVKEIKENEALAEAFLFYYKNKISSVHGIDIAIYKKLSKKVIDVRRDPCVNAYCVNESNFMPFYIPYELVKEVEDNNK